jgi:DNA invertase Pin-like site-specific DNA recombinase
VFVDRGESAKTIDRPEFRAMLDHCRANRGKVHAVVVYAVSRFARNTTDHVTVRALLARYGVGIRSATENIDDSPQGKLIEGVTSVLAEYENNVKAERTKVGMAEALRNGRWTFQPPLGYVRSGSRQESTLLADPIRAPLVVQAFELMMAGTCSKKHALDVVTAAGLRTLAGRRLGQQAFDRLLRNPIYAGRLQVRRWQVDEPSSFPPLVPRELFDAVQAVLHGRRVVAKVH